MISVIRPLVPQDGNNFAVALAAGVATPINSQMQLTSMIDTILICVPSTSTNVFLGFNQALTAANGIEIISGNTVLLRVEHDTRQLYELQGPLIDLVASQLCRPMQIDAIPFVVWDVSQLYLFSTLANTVAVATFKASYA